MYCLRNADNADLSAEIPTQIVSLFPSGNEWWTVSIRELIVNLCELRKRPVSALFLALDQLVKNFGGQIVLIPTSRDVATATARAQVREDFELRGYYRDTMGRYISHVRIHDSLRRQING